MPNGAGNQAACRRPDSRGHVPASTQCGPTDTADTATDPVVPGRPARLHLGKETHRNVLGRAGVHRVTRRALKPSQKQHSQYVSRAVCWGVNHTTTDRILTVRDVSSGWDCLS